MKRCDACPSFMGAALSSDQQARFGKALAVPMCGRYGHVLGTASTTEQDAEQIFTSFAMNCDAFGEPLPATPVTISPRVTSADATVLSRGQTSNGTATCLKCANCVTGESVYSNFGWTVPLCRAKGTLILKPLKEAKDCPWAVSGIPSGNINGLEVRPEFIPGFRIPTEAVVKEVVLQSNSNVDPSEYPTDAPVDEEDAAKGIRAWRKINGPAAGLAVFAPIFRRDHFTPEQQAMIPEAGDTGHPELYIDYSNNLYKFFVESFVLRETPIIEGEPGTGKTQFMRWVAWLCQMPFVRVQCDDQMDVDSVTGTMQYSPDKGTYFDPGVLPRAWESVCVLCIDEYNVAPDALQQIVRPMADDSKEMRIGNLRFFRNEYCFFGMTQNPAWDPRNIGTKQLADADTNRVGFLVIQNPSDPIERHIIKSYCVQLDGWDIPDETVSTMMAVAEDIRNLAENHEYPGSWTTRQQIKVARKLRWYDPMTAYMVAAFNSLEPETQRNVVGLVATHFRVALPDGEYPEDDSEPESPF